MFLYGYAKSIAYCFSVILTSYLRLHSTGAATKYLFAYLFWLFKYYINTVYIFSYNFFTLDRMFKNSILYFSIRFGEPGAGANEIKQVFLDLSFDNDSNI